MYMNVRIAYSRDSPFPRKTVNDVPWSCVTGDRECHFPSFMCFSPWKSMWIQNEKWGFFFHSYCCSVIRNDHCHTDNHINRFCFSLAKHFFFFFGSVLFYLNLNTWEVLNASSIIRQKVLFYCFCDFQALGNF